SVKTQPAIKHEDDIITEVYGSTAEDRMFMDSARASYITFSLEEMDDDAFIDKVSKTPACNRPTNFKQQVRDNDSNKETRHIVNVREEFNTKNEPEENKDGSKPIFF
ncbi:MAG: hypothetical protein RR015_06020, partial [Bacteroidales bacterium]